ncbi:MAG: hypothetical protein JW856_00655, partial [Dehalococcoidales bacterium]|nr:hypothetical protein [Dehalococcoidales bacterium]
FLPFYLIVIFRTMGIKKVIVAVGIIAGLFLATNLPFIVPAPRLWAESIIAPLHDPMFPMGVGMISVVMGEVINIQSGLVFTILEILVGLAAVAWYYFNCRRFPDSGPVLAVLPLFFAWRSLWGYFFFVDIIILASILINDYRNPDELSPIMDQVSHQKFTSAR